MSDIKPCVRASFCETLDSPQFLKSSLNIIALFGFPIHLFGAYCIIARTPAQMASMKWVMLNLHIWSVGLDILFCYLIVPYIYTPVLAGYSLGILNSLGVSTASMYYICCVQIAGVMTSVALLFETRFFILYARESFWRHLRRPWLIVNFIIGTTYMIPTYLAIPDQPFGRWFQFRRYPCLPPEVYDDRVFILSTWSTGVAWNMNLNTAPQQTILFVVLIFWNMKKSCGQVKMSKKTADLQRKFLRALILQVTIPVVTVICPLLYSTFATLNSYYNQGLNNLTVCIMATHGIVSSAAMIYLHKSYWNTFLSLICPNLCFIAENRVFTVT